MGSEGINQGFRFEPDKSDLPSRPPVEVLIGVTHLGAINIDIKPYNRVR